MNLFQQVKESLLHLVFPHVCEGCGSDAPAQNELLCLKCISDLPRTNFHFFYNNPIEKIFWGRLAVRQAAAIYYFTKESRMQHLMHQLKYKGNRELGIYLGNLMGKAILETGRFQQIDALVPLPLHPSKEKARGYNQAGLLCKGISEVIKKPVMDKSVIRISHTETQTHKSRTERWKNMEGRFTVTKTEDLKGKHILLIDDVITTGASLEACGTSLLQVPELELSICTLCYASTV